jgi:predicted nucleic acid-binding protein
LRYWDSSALIPLLLTEPRTPEILEIYRQDPAMAVWCLTPYEIWAAIARRRKEGRLRSPDIRTLRVRLSALARDWTVIRDPDAIGKTAYRILDVHGLGPAQAIQISAALAIVGGSADEIPFVTLDDRVAQAAIAEGLSIMP